MDLLTKYEDGIVSVSLGGPAVMRFEYVGEPPQRRGHLQHGEAGRNAPQQDSGQRGPEETQRGQDDTSQQCVLKGASRPWPEYTEVGDWLGRIRCGLLNIASDIPASALKAWPAARAVLLHARATVITDAQSNTGPFRALCLHHRNGGCSCSTTLLRLL